jgi:multimeric flavodoxin WrbA
MPGMLSSVRYAAQGSAFPWAHTLHMPSILVVYFSATGATAKLAEAVRAGASELLPVVVYPIAGKDIVAGRFRNEEALALVDAAEGVIFGSPTYMGGPAAQFKAFADATGDRWSRARWKNKVSAGFTTGTCPNGDQSYTLNYFAVFAAQHGMIWCNLDIPGGYDPKGRNRLGTQVGVASESINGIVNELDLQTATSLGQRVAQLTLRLCAAN